jgi:diguanylate cyclase (GGDEF)-like protein/PAS domain S-box-containing protein
MTEADIEFNKPDNEPDTLILDVKTAAEFIGSHDVKERKFGAAALQKALTFGIETEENGKRLARLLRVRDDVEGNNESNTSLCRADEAVKESLERYEKLVGGVHDVVFDLDKYGNISFINDAITKVAGYEASDLIDLRFTQIVYRNDLKKVDKGLKNALDGNNESFEFRIYDKNSGIKWMLASANILKDKESTCGMTVQMKDVTEIKKLYMQLKAKNRELGLKTKELKIKSEYDTLTGLFNREKAEEEIEKLKNGRRKNKFPISILFVDVDDFKSINTKYGHKSGDNALQTVSYLLRCGVTREEDFVARYGGDEFIILLQQTTNEDAQTVVERINNAFIGYNDSENDRLSVSIGIATADESKTLSETIEKADKAMFEVKTQKKDNQVVATTEL